MKAYLLIPAVVLFISCNYKAKDKENSKETTTDPGTEKSVSVVDGCYMKITGRDTVILMLEQIGDELTGKMLFDNYQKDGSRGSVSGKVEGEIVKIWYDFFAEGIHSVMEINFKNENEKLVRGIGDIDVKGDTAYYKDPAGIGYSESETFTKTGCALLQGKMNFTK